MKALPDFGLETYFSEWEFKARYDALIDLCRQRGIYKCTGVVPVRVGLKDYSYRWRRLDWIG